MNPFRRKHAPGTARGRFERSGFDRLAAVQVLSPVEIERRETAAGFRSYDEEAELLLADKDGRLLRAGELRRSRRLRAERRALSTRAGAARALADQRRRDFEQASRLLGDAREAVPPTAFRGISHRAYLRRKVILGLGEAVSLAVAFTVAFDVPPLEGLVLSAGIALAFVVAGDLGGLLRLSADGERAPAPGHGRRWLVAAWCLTAGLFVLAASAVGALRAGGGDGRGPGLAVAMAVLTLVLAVASGLSSWRHASAACDRLDYLERAERQAARAWARAARSPVLARFDALGEEIDVRWRAVEERAAARLRLAGALCAWFRARHPQLFGHGVGAHRPAPNGTAPNGLAAPATNGARASRS